MSFSNISSLQQIRARVNNTLSHGIQIDMSTEESKKLLIRHVNTKTNLVIMFIDINGSTEMSLSLSDDKFSKVIQTFAQEISMP
jgi:adenylate cyclase